jgi:multiple sugar transport system substrate-binding protein
MARNRYRQHLRPMQGGTHMVTSVGLAMSRRRLAAAGLTALSAAAAACAPGGSSGGSGSGAQTTPAPAGLVFLTRGSEHHRQIFDRFAEEFKQVQPRVTVTQEFVAGGTPLFLEKETTLVAAGQQADVCFNEAIRWREAAAKGLYEVLDPYLAKERQLLAEVFPYFVDIGKWQGKNYATPIDPSMYVMVYNLRVWQNAGVPAPDPKQPLTWPEFTDRTKRLTKEQDGRFAQFGYDGANVHDVLLLYQQASGKAPFNDDVSRWNLDQPEAITQIQFLADMRRNQKAAFWPAAATEGPVNWDNGKIGATIRGIWGMGTWRSQHPDQWDWAPYPQLPAKKRLTAGRGSGLSMGSQTKHKPETWEFMKWSLSTTGQEIYLAMGASMPLTKSMANSPAWTEPALPKNKQVVLDEMQHGVAPWFFAGAARFLTLFEPALTAVWNGEQTAQQMVTELTPQVTQLLTQLKSEFGGKI